MTYSWPVYIALGIVFTASFVFAWFLPTNEIMRGIVASPAIVALVGVVYQIFRDHATYEKTLALQRDQQHFALGVTSHMANVAFDRHVEFCEKYMARMQQGLSELLQKGPSNDCLQFRNDLVTIRLSYRAWLTTEVQDKILPFENAIGQIAVMHMSLEGLSDREQRMKKIESLDDKFCDVLGLERIQGRGERDETVVAGRIMDHMQALIGARSLFSLRMALIDRAVKTLEKRG